MTTSTHFTATSHGPAPQGRPPVAAAAPKKRFSPALALGYAVVLLGGLLMLMPFYFMFVFATHTNSAILSVPPPLWFGSAFLDNLGELLKALPYFWNNLGWSTYVALAVTALNLFFCSLAGYAFALLDFRGRERLFSAVMATKIGRAHV
jgi:multiple sugar transport system permease protein